MKGNGDVLKVCTTWSSGFKVWFISKTATLGVSVVIHKQFCLSFKLMHYRDLCATCLLSAFLLLKQLHHCQRRLQGDK